MADDQSSKSSTIDELVNELTKQKVANPPPLSSPQSPPSSMRPSQPFQTQTGPGITPQNRSPFPSPRSNIQPQQAGPDLSKSQYTAPPAPMPKPSMPPIQRTAPSPQPIA